MDVTTVEMLDRLVAKAAKSKKVSDRQVPEGARHLLDLCKQENGEALVADYLYKLPLSICHEFFEMAVSQLELDQVKRICTAIRDHEQYTKNNKYRGATQIFITSAALIGAKDSFGLELLVATLKSCMKKDKLPPTVVTAFREKVLTPCRAKAIMDLGENLWGDGTSHKKNRKMLENLISQAVETPTSKASAGATQKDTQEKPSVPITDEKPALVAEGKISMPENNSATAQASPHVDTDVQPEVDALLQMVQKANSEMQTLLRTIVNTNETPSALRKQITDRDDQIRAFRVKAAEDERRMSALQAEIDLRDTAIAKLRVENDDLTDRLKRTLQLNATEDNQALAALKADIVTALKLEYVDYQDSMEKAYSPDQFEAAQASLSRIFKKLKRLNITFD